MKALTLLFATASLFAFQAAKAQMSSDNNPVFSKGQLTAVQSEETKMVPVTQAAAQIQVPQPPAQIDLTSNSTEQAIKTISQFSSADFSTNMDEQMFRLKVRYANLQYQLEMLKAELETLKQ